MPEFEYRHRVTYADCTVGNHVYYARFLELLEAARGAFFRQLGQSFLDLEHQGIALPVRSCHLEYQAPAHYDEILHIQVWVRELARVKVAFEYRITGDAGRLVLDAWTLHGCVDAQNRPHRLPAVLATALNPFLAPSELP